MPDQDKKEEKHNWHLCGCEACRKKREEEEEWARGWYQEEGYGW